MAWVIVVLGKVDEVYCMISCEESTAREISEYFTFEVPGAKFMPSYRSRVWDGKIRLFNMGKRLLYNGLINHLSDFCLERNYELVLDPEVILRNENITPENLLTFIRELNIHEISPRPYQLDAILYAIRNPRCVLVSPTASGKSLIIYTLLRWNQGKSLVIVPTTSLVEQLYKDFQEYAKGTDWKVGNNCHRIYSGREKETNLPISISTWQSMYKLPKPFFENFDMIIGDEAHTFKAKSLTTLMTKLVNARHRIGTTGTLDGTQTNKLVFEGLFGPAYQVISTKKLMDQDYLAELEIHCIVLQYGEEERKLVSSLDYQKEIQFIVGYDKRTEFITDMVSNLKGNTLILFQLVGKHGQKLFESVKLKNPKRNVYFIHGGTPVDERERVRELTEKSDNTIIVASYGTFSTGINIRKLHNVIFASPSKSRIRNLQSIGRVLRLGEDKNKAILFDISDDLSYNDKKNYTLRHLIERIKIYNSEKFNYKLKKFNI